MNVSRHKLCSVDRGEQFAKVVVSLKEEWTLRKGGLSTLGAAAYIDSPLESEGDLYGANEVPIGQYEQQLARSNPVLRKHFEPLYQKVMEALEDNLQARVRFSEGKALPGFHIFEYAPENARAASHVAHFDRQYEPLDWKEPIHRLKNTTLSFTLPLRLPQSGGGLFVWEVLLDEILKMDDHLVRPYLKKVRPKLIKYEVGQLIIHPGHALHMISPWQSEPDEQRITLQGHCIKLNGGWEAYW